MPNEDLQIGTEVKNRVVGWYIDKVQLDYLRSALKDLGFYPYGSDPDADGGTRYINDQGGHIFVLEHSDSQGKSVVTTRQATEPVVESILGTKGIR